MQKKGVSQNQFKKDLGFNHNWFYNIENQSQSISVTTAYKIASYFGITLYDLIDDCIVKD